VRGRRKVQDGGLRKMEKMSERCVKMRTKTPLDIRRGTKDLLHLHN